MAKRHRGVTPEQAEIIQLRESGLSWSQIAAQMGMRRDACCVLYGRGQKELARRAGLEKTVENYRGESRRSPYAKVGRRAERELAKARELDGVPMRRKARPEPPTAPLQAVQQPLEPAPSAPRKVYRFPSGATFEHPSRGPNVRVQIHKNLLGQWVDEKGERVEPVDTEPAPCLGATLNDDGSWSRPAAKPDPMRPIPAPAGALHLDPANVVEAERRMALSGGQYRCRCRGNFVDANCTGQKGCMRGL